MILIQVRSGKTLDEALQNPARACWFFKVLTKADRAPVMSAIMESRVWAEQVERIAKHRRK